MTKLVQKGVIVFTGIFLIICGCAQIIKDANNFYLKTPMKKKFIYKMKSVDGKSEINGFVTFDSTEVKWPTNNQPTYYFSGNISSELTAELKTKQTAITWGPIFMTESSADAIEKLCVIGPKNEDLGLPGVYTIKIDGQAKSEIVEKAMKYPAEIVSVWLKCIIKELNLHQKSLTVEPLDSKKVTEDSDCLVVAVSFTGEGGQQIGKCTCLFRKYTSLSSIEFRYTNGDIVTLTETEKP